MRQGLMWSVSQEIVLESQVQGQPDRLAGLGPVIWLRYFLSAPSPGRQQQSHPATLLFCSFFRGLLTELSYLLVYFRDLLRLNKSF